MSAALRALVALALLAVFAPAAHALELSPWTTAVNAESVLGTSVELNTDAQDGCPIQSPDRLSLYMASTRPGGKGGLDIWVAHRESRDDPWGPPENLPEPINSSAADFCPTPIRGGGLFFVSRRETPGVTCGMGDIYLTRLSPGTGWETPQHLGCESDGGPNTPLDEQGPTYLKNGGPVLYFSSGIPSGPGVSGDIYQSKRQGDGNFGPPQPVARLNSTAVDIQPNVRHDGREIVFASNRDGTLGAQDLWVATRAGVNDPWSTPVNLGGAVNTSGFSETRPSLSWDGATLYFGRALPTDPGTSDIFVSTREKIGDYQR
jgi:hypothetical protein